MEHLVRVWARLGAYVDLEPGNVLSDLDGMDLDMLYAEGKINFDGDSYIPDETMDDDIVVKEIEERETFDLYALRTSVTSKAAFTNVLNSIKSIPDYLSFADVDESLKEDINKMAKGFLVAIQHKLTSSLK